MEIGEGDEEREEEERFRKNSNNSSKLLHSMNWPQGTFLNLDHPPSHTPLTPLNSLLLLPGLPSPPNHQYPQQQLWGISPQGLDPSNDPFQTFHKIP
jgi:hypothetical protein